MPAHMPSLSSIDRKLFFYSKNGLAKQTLKCFNILFLVHAGDSTCFAKHCSYMLFLLPFLFLLCALARAIHDFFILGEGGKLIS